MNYESIIDSLNAIVLTIEFDGTMSYINKYGEEFTGYSLKEISSRPYFWADKFLPKNIRPDIQSIITSMVDNRTFIDKKTNVWIDKNGDERMIEWTNSFEITENNQPRLSSVGIDISEKVTLQQQLEEMQQKNTHLLEEKVLKSTQEIYQSRQIIKNIIDTVPVRIFWKDIHNRYLGANKLFLNDAQLEDESQIIGKTDYDLIWKANANLYIEDDNKVMETKISKLRFEEPQTYEDGSMIYLVTSKVPLIDNDGNVYGILGVYDDITEQKLAQIELKKKDLVMLEQSKMASMGEMIGNIAHQWRQPLSAISVSAGTLGIKYETNTLTAQDVQDIEHNIVSQTEYLSKTIDTFKNFIRGGNDKEELSICDVIEEGISLIKDTFLQKHIAIKNQEHCEEICGTKTLLSKNELIQVIINILNNSKDAIIQNEIKNSWVQIRYDTKDNNTIISIEDNGGGIPENVLPHVFEPYYTTKHQSQGTGLGLHMSYKIITESMHGNIYASNTENGALFTIEIPLGNKEGE